MSLVPIASLGNRYGVSVRGMESIIGLACIAHQTDYWYRGRTVDRLGIQHLSVSELTRLVTGKPKAHIPRYSRSKQSAILCHNDEPYLPSGGMGVIAQN